MQQSNRKSDDWLSQNLDSASLWFAVCWGMPQLIRFTLREALEGAQELSCGGSKTVHIRSPAEIDIPVEQVLRLWRRHGFLPTQVLRQNG